MTMPANRKPPIKLKSRATGRQRPRRQGQEGGTVAAARTIAPLARRLAGPATGRHRTQRVAHEAREREDSGKGPSAVLDLVNGEEPGRESPPSCQQDAGRGIEEIGVGEFMVSRSCCRSASAFVVDEALAHAARLVPAPPQAHQEPRGACQCVVQRGAPVAGHGGDDHRACADGPRFHLAAPCSMPPRDRPRPTSAHRRAAPASPDAAARSERGARSARAVRWPGGGET